MNKTSQFVVRVTDNQYKKVKELASKEEKRPSEYIRDVLFNQNSILPGNDPIVQLTKLKKKYIEDKAKEHNIMKSHAISMKINTLDEIIIDLSSLNS